MNAIVSLTEAQRIDLPLCNEVGMIFVFADNMIDRLISFNGLDTGLFLTARVLLFNHINLQFFVSIPQVLCS